MSNLSNENRRLICKCLDEGRNNIHGLSQTFDVSDNTIRRIWDKSELTIFPIFLFNLYFVY